MSIPARLFLTATTALIAIPAVAQDSTQAPDEAEGEIVVIGEGLAQAPSVVAYAVSEIERAEIVAAPSGRIEDVLVNVAGFQQFRRSDSRSSNPSAQGVTLRALGGNATSRALVLLDGVPMADPFFGYIPLSAIAPEQLAAIRVTRGGGSGPFGAGALAGTIELESADAAALGPFAASLLTNDRSETEASASLAQELGSGFGVLSARWDRGQGFYTTPRDERVPASARAAFDSWSVGLRGVAPLSDTVELQARVLAFRDQRTLRFDGADSSSEGQDASLRLVGRGDWQFDAVAYVQARNFSNVVVSATRFVRVLDQRNTPSTGLGSKFELRPPVGGDHTLRLGIDYRRAEGELQEEAYSAFTGNLSERRRAGGTNTNLGLFVEDDWRAGALTLTGGLRADRTSIADGFYRAVDALGALVDETVALDRADWALSWRAGAAFDASDALRLRAAAYTGLRLPTLNELYRPFVVFPVVTEANAELRNERLEGFEAGFDFSPSDRFELSMTAFENRVENAIANVTLTQILRQRQNLPAIEARGIEASAKAVLGSVRLDSSIVYSDASIEGRGASADVDGNRPPQTPRWAASTTFAWTPAVGWELAATLRHVGAQYEDEQETDRLPPATTLGFFARVTLRDKLQLVLRGENLTGERIVTRNSGGSTDLGAPRTLWAGLRYGF
ncbi:TonB-dependent receptor plug domain-containing protein [Altererythrobacter sp. Z27]|uniref:TonB-dependent receptor plug domain-containing protein n=1 Tax=Altererythrobacter sp. Z27 TaxID=3461147 RepID=UPI004043A93B